MVRIWTGSVFSVTNFSFLEKRKLLGVILKLTNPVGQEQLVHAVNDVTMKSNYVARELKTHHHWTLTIPFKHRL